MQRRTQWWIGWTVVALAGIAWGAGQQRQGAQDGTGADATCPGGGLDICCAGDPAVCPEGTPGTCCAGDPTTCPAGAAARAGVCSRGIGNGSNCQAGDAGAGRGCGWGRGGRGPGAGTGGGAGACGAVLVPTGALTEAEAERVVQMREEEKLARDVYLALAAQWQTPLFAGIAEAELRHMTAVQRLIAAYGLTDPVADPTPGVFTAPTFQSLYEDLTQRGQASLTEALKVGCFIEELDIVDLDAGLAPGANAQVQAIFSHLQRGSRNHLRAFDGVLRALGVGYEPSVMTADAYAAIVTASPERGGPGAGGGQGLRRGQGRSPDCGTNPACLRAAAP